MKLFVNGEDMDTKAATLKELIGELSLMPERVAVEVNLSVIRKSAYGTFRLAEGDRVEIVNFVGGG